MKPSSSIRSQRKPGIRALRLGLAALILASPSAFAFNVYTVGVGVGCKYSNVQDAINAAAASPGEDYVWISQSATYTNQAITISNQDVIVEGGFANCTDNEPASGARTLLQGASGHSVIYIIGNSNVELYGLEISGGSPSDRGGGVSFAGTGGLVVSQSYIHNNQAGYGGGIDMNPSGRSTLTLISSFVTNNTASKAGGGIRVEGQSTLSTDSSSYILENKALGQGDTAYGGGVQVIGPAQAQVSSKVWLNSAAYGGGLAVLGHDNDSASLSLFTADATSPVSVLENTASHTGGGVFLKGDTEVGGSGSTAYLYARDFSIDDNVAANGAAIYGDTVSSNLFGDGDYHGVYVYLNGAFPVTLLAPVTCTVGQGCDDISDNYAQDSSGNATGGATVLIQSEGELQANRFAARRNHGGSLFQFVDDSADYGPPPASTLHNCLLVDNVETAPLILVNGNADGSRLTVDSCTITNNTVDTASVPAYTIGAGVNYLQLTNSIIYDLGAQVVNFNNGRPADDLTAQYDLVNNSSTLPNGYAVLKGAPLFVNAPPQDYHLLSSSLGVDYAPGESGVDLDGNARSVDLPGVSNIYGPMDLGAYEIQLPRIIIHPIGPISPVSTDARK